MSISVSIGVENISELCKLFSLNTLRVAVLSDSEEKISFEPEIYDPLYEIKVIHKEASK